MSEGRVPYQKNLTVQASSDYEDEDNIIVFSRTVTKLEIYNMDQSEAVRVKLNNCDGYTTVPADSAVAFTDLKINKVAFAKPAVSGGSSVDLEIVAGLEH